MMSIYPFPDYRFFKFAIYIFHRNHNVLVTKKKLSNNHQIAIKKNPAQNA